MSAVFERLVTELRTRGPAGFARFIALRLMQRRADVLFEFDLHQLPACQAGDDAIMVVDRANLGSAATARVERDVLGGPNHEYVAELRARGQLLATTDAHGKVTSYAFVVFESFYKRILGEDGDTPVISNCFTEPAWRGQGLYPRLLRASCRHLAAQGYLRAVITCAPDNLASVRGIEKAGFRRVKTLYSLIFFARWIAVQRVKLPIAERG